MNQLDAPTVFTALKDRDDKVRASAVRLSESFLKSTQRAVALQRLKEMTGDDATLVQQQLVLTLGEAESQEADDAIAMIVRRSIGTAFVGDAAITGLFGRELELLERLLADAAWSGAESQRDRFLGMLARCVFVSRKSDRCERLLELVANERTRPKRMIALLDGLIEATASFGKRPVKLSREPAAFASFLLVDTKKTARIAALVTWPGKVGTKPEPPPVPLTARQMANFQLGKTLYGGVCAACHQLHGLGMEGLAPPLVDSEWVNGSEKRLVRIVLHGLTGPIKVRERTYNLDMPALGAFSDDQIAAILTYVRREWDHTANPVEPETVSAIRAANKLRLEGWRQEELLNIP